MTLQISNQHDAAGGVPWSRSPVRDRVGAFVRRHPLRTYLIIFTLFGQPLAFLPVIAGRVAGVELDTDLVLIVPTMLFILLPTLLITRYVRGRDGLRALVRQLVRFDVPLRWYLVPLLVMPLLSLAATFALPAEGLHPATLATVYLTGFLPTLAFNFLTTNWWEETLWTGFFQGTLQQRGHSAARAALIVTPFFALQHIALGPTGSVTQWLAWLAILTVAIIPVRFLFAWMYNRTASTALVGLTHAAANAIAATLIPRLYHQPADGVLPLAVLGLLALLLTRGRLGLAPRPAVERTHPETSP